MAVNSFTCTVGERGFAPNRPTNDADAALDVRARPEFLLEFTRALTEIGFATAGSNMSGHQYRWIAAQLTPRDRDHVQVGLAGLKKHRELWVAIDGAERGVDVLDRLLNR